MEASEANQQHALELRTGIEELFLKQEFSDITIRCKNKILPAHKSVICTQCGFFFKSCTTNMLEEKATNIIDLSEDEYDAVHAMIEYIYKGYYKKGDNLDEMLLHVHTWTMAEKYNLPSLQLYAEERFAAVVKGRSREPVFQTAIELVFSMTPEHDPRLRNIVVSLACENVGPLVRAEGFSELLHETPIFAINMVMKIGESANKAAEEVEMAESRARPGPKKRSKVTTGTAASSSRT